MNSGRIRTTITALLCSSVLLFVSRDQAQTINYISVKGSVFNETGDLQQDVRIVFSSGADPRKTVQYDIAASGTFDVPLLPAVPYNLRIMANAYPLQYYDPAAPDMNADGPPEAQLIFNADDSLVVRLTQAPRQISGLYGFIQGIVTDSMDRPLRQAEVMVMMPGKDVVADVFTDSAGSFLCKVPAQPQFVSAFCFPYPTQYWSVSGTTGSPSSQGLVNVPSNGMTPIKIALRMNPQNADGSVSISGLSANAYVNDSNRLWITCNVPPGLNLDTLVLYSKDRFGDIVKLAAFPYSSQQTMFSWEETRPWLPSFFSYVFTGTGANSVRSNITGYDPLGGRKISPDSLLDKRLSRQVGSAR
jgi:hypothetical protein